MLSLIIFTTILSQNQQDIRSRASTESVDNLPSLVSEFVSPQGRYKLVYDPRQWTQAVEPDQVFGSKAIFTLNKEYGSARVDIMEGESKTDLNGIKDTILQNSSSANVSVEISTFNGTPSYRIRYKETILGEDVYHYKQVMKNGDNFLIFEERAPQLGYDQSFVDNLRESVSFIGTGVQKVKGTSNSLTNLTTIQLVDLIRPSIVNILYAYCLEIANLQPTLSGLSRPRYNFCASAKGSGFIINEEGIIATNGHVAKIYPEEALITNLLYEDNKAFSTDLIRGIYLSKGQNPTQNQIEDAYNDLDFNPQYLDRFLTEIFKLIGSKIISVSTNSEKYYANVGNEPIKIDQKKAIIPSDTTYVASLIDFDYSNKYSFDAIVNKKYTRGADVALLKINSTDAVFPTIELSNKETLREGSDVIVAGYPTLVEGEEDPRAAISYKTSQRPTITRGIVSSIKQDLSGKTVFQTDASIDHGNSGGPAFNALGQVIGIATFITESKSGNFNFLRDILELKELMAKNKVENKLGNVSNLWRNGLSNFNNRYYQKAIEDFRQVKTLSKSHPTVDEFIQLSKESIAKGESLEGLASFIKGENSNILLAIFGTISLVSFMSAGFLAALPLFTKDNSLANLN